MNISIHETPLHGFERVVQAQSADLSYTGFVIVHSTRMGPAVGGVRMWDYALPDDALADALRLARAMTCKNVMAGLPFGGGKSVIIASAAPRQNLLRAHAHTINYLNGTYIGAGDVGVSPEDVEYLRNFSPHIARATSTQLDSGFYTAVGVMAAMRAAANALWQSSDLSARTIVVQGCGKVGASLAALLQSAGARTVVADIDEARAAHVADRTGATMVTPEHALSHPCDILSPCAVGPLFTRHNAGTLATRAIVGGANCQLESDEVADLLAAHGILYVPDFVANAGGVISGMVTLAGWPLPQVEQHIADTYERVRHLLARSESTGQTALRTALALADQRLAEALHQIK